VIKVSCKTPLPPRYQHRLSGLCHRLDADRRPRASPRHGCRSGLIRRKLPFQELSDLPLNAPASQWRFADTSAQKFEQPRCLSQNRQNFSFPPAITVLASSKHPSGTTNALRSDWMQKTRKDIRTPCWPAHQLASELQRLSGSDALLSRRTPRAVLAPWTTSENCRQACAKTTHLLW